MSLEIKPVIVRLDMVHTELFMLLKKMKDQKSDSVVLKKTSIECLESLTWSAMKDLIPLTELKKKSKK